MGHALAFGLLCVVLCIAAVTDLLTEKIYDWLTYPAFLAGLVVWLGVGWAEGGIGGAGSALIACAAAVAVGFGPFLVVFYLGGLGGGDVKLMAAIGTLTASWQCVLDTMVYGLAVAVVWAVVVMITHGIVKQTMVRVLNAVVAAAGRAKVSLESDSPRVPLAFSFCVGGVVAGMQHLLGLFEAPWHT